MISLILRLLPIGQLLLLAGGVAFLQMAGIDVIGMALDVLGLSDPTNWVGWL
jgi:hypothetical protein